MTDTIIKGTGNSQSIRSVPNLAALAPTYDALLALLTSENGLPVDIGQLNPSGCDVVGTANNKANLLSDEAASLYGLTPENATPNKVFEILGKNFETGSYKGTADSGSSDISAISIILQRQPLLFCLRGGYGQNENNIVVIAFIDSNKKVSGLGMSGAYEFKLSDSLENYYDVTSSTLYLNTKNSAYPINYKSYNYNWIAIY